MIGEPHFIGGICYVEVNDGGTLEKLSFCGFFKQLKIAIKHKIRPYTVAALKEEVYR